MFNKEAIQELAKSQAIASAQESMQAGVTEGARALVALPQEFTLRDLETYLPNRRRQRGTMSTTSVPDFAAYADSLKEEGATIFIDAETMKAVAVLNLGTAAKPGHADNLAALELKKTAAFKALSAINGTPMHQQQAAEFLEDWTSNIVCTHEGDVLENAKAIAAVRSITVEAARKLEVEVKQLSASKSAFDSVQASSKFTLPTEIRFTCQPYHNLDMRVFTLRLSIITYNDKANINLRIIKLEEHEEYMAQELVKIVTSNFAPESGIHVGIGKYAVK